MSTTKSITWRADARPTRLTAGAMRFFAKFHRAESRTPTPLGSRTHSFPQRTLGILELIPCYSCTLDCTSFSVHASFPYEVGVDYCLALWRSYIGIYRMQRQAWKKRKEEK